MKTKITLLLALFIFTQYLFAQQAVDIVTEKSNYRIDGTHLLEERNAEVAKFLRENPDYSEKAKLKKTNAWNFKVGDTKTWTAFNFRYNRNENVPSTCRGVGNHCYVFVFNEILHWITQRVADSIIEAFDNRTPANPSKGIYQTNVETFGEPPDYDNDPKIIILLLDIQDNLEDHIMGYFDAKNEFFDNEAEILFIDAWSIFTLPFPDRLNLVISSTIAHVFQHMIHWNYHQTEPNLAFINEGCSLVAEVVNGYPLYEQILYANDPNHYLFDWETTTIDKMVTNYSRAAKFTLYLYEQFGTEILKHLVQSTALGIDIYTDALLKVGATVTFDEVLQNWFMANILNDKTIRNEWGYSYTPIVKSSRINNYNPTVNKGGVVERFAVEYVSFVHGEGLLEVDFSTPSTLLITKVLKEGPGKKEVFDITPGVIFSEPVFGTTYTTITFIIMNPTDNVNPYSINAKGKANSLELKHDNSEALGWFSSGPLDTLCVAFNRILGGRLDSITIAPRKEGSLIASIHTYTGTNHPSPFGKRLSEYFALYSKDLLPPPHPGPYPNWVKQDLTNQNISTDYPFAVAIGVQEDTTTFAHVMVAAVPGRSFAGSFDYIYSEKYWTYRISSDATRTWQYMIRAYVGFDNTSEVVELTPSYFKLEQNYPNPFNPSTKIQFTLDKTGMTKLTIYDILGRELTTLVNEMKDAGTYEITFNATNYASGVYYYKLQSDNIVQTKKMILLK